MDSTSSLHNGQQGGMFSPLLFKASLVGMLRWKYCQRKHLILGSVEIFQIQFPMKWSQWGLLCIVHASLQASLNSNSPFGDEDQEILSTPVANMGMGVALIFWPKDRGRTNDKHPKFQKLFLVISLSKIVSLFLWKGPIMRLLIGPSLNHLSC